MTDPKAAENAAAADRKYARTCYAALSALNGYAEIFSVFAGEPVHIRLARKPSRLALLQPKPRLKRVELREAVTGAVTKVAVPAGLAILRQEPKNYRDEGAAYRTRLAIATAALAPGLYECVVRDNLGAVSKGIYFNVKPERHRGYDLICVLPTFTWQAYNRIAGGSFYSKSLGRVRTISTQRPTGHAGDNSIGAAIPFLRAFAQAGARLACVDSRDLHLGLRPSGRAPVMALLTHDEYWSEAMRRDVERYLKRGGVLMVMAGNVCWWKIAVEGDNLTVDNTWSVQSHNWYMQGEPEERTFVSSFRFGGYAAERIAKKAHLRKAVSGIDKAAFENAGSLKIRRPDHPIFAGVALDPGDRLGEEVPLVYREIDAVPLAPDGSVDRTLYDGGDVAPEILATGTVVRSSPSAPVIQAGIVVEADVGGGHVLHMGTFGWSRGLGQGNARVKQVVQNAYRYCRTMARERMDI